MICGLLNFSKVWIAEFLFPGVTAEDVNGYWKTLLILEGFNSVLFFYTLRLVGGFSYPPIKLAADFFMFLCIVDLIDIIWFDRTVVYWNDIIGFIIDVLILIYGARVSIQNWWLRTKITK